MSRRSLPTHSFALLVVFALLGACASAPPPPPPSDSSRACNTRPDYHRVVRGDALFNLAWRYCLNYLEIARWNRLRNPDLIRVGQRLRLSPPLAGETRERPSRAVVKAKPRKPRRLVAAKVPTPASKPKPAKKPAKVVKQQQPATTADWQWPAKGKVVSKFNPDVPGRNGIRIRGKPGQPVRAVSGGSIVYTGDSLPGYGTLIIVEHGGGVLSAYGHLGKTYVQQGDRVQRGQTIAELGSGSDDLPTLHFEVRKKGQPVNPLRYLSS